jgi:hypothetical protein
VSENKTRQNISRDEVNPESSLNTGYQDQPTDGITIPSCGIEDCDIALFNLFDKDIGFSSQNIRSANKNIQTKKPTVIFLAGERFAQARKLRPPRDKNNKLMMPAITIRRTGITQDSSDITGRGINQTTGILTIKRKLSSFDQDYQNILNKYAFSDLSGNIESERDDIGEEQNSFISQKGLHLKDNIGNNVWEVINIPQPSFFTATYDVSFWTTYIQQMNGLIETYISSFLPQKRAHKLVSEKGYWFIAYTQDSLSSADNFDDFTDEARIVRYSFSINVKGYALATQHGTNKVPVTSWISSPRVSFEVSQVSNQILPAGHLEKQATTMDKFRLTDFNELKQNPASKQAPTTNETFKEKVIVKNEITGKKEVKYVFLREESSSKGETSYQAPDKKTLDAYIKSFKAK